jgi:hypothetical protein
VTYLLHSLLLLRHRVFPVVAAVFASGLRLLPGHHLAARAKGVEEAECGKELVVGVLEFVEEAVTGRVAVANVEPRAVFGPAAHRHAAAAAAQVLTFVLFPTHLIII